MKSFKIIEYGNRHSGLKNKFHEFISNVFPGANFKEWEEKGFWTDDYICYSIIESDKIISNVSASIMNVIINGQSYKAVQLGAVGTLPEYRGQGLSKKIIDFVIELYNDKTDLMFLYGNDSVMDFYPKFGFRNFAEKIFSVDHPPVKQNFSAKKMNIFDQKDFDLLLKLIDTRKSLTNIFGAENYGFITMWHILNHHAENLFYLPEEDTIFIKTENENVLHIWEVIFQNQFDLHSAIPKIIGPNGVESIRFYFPPDQINFTYDKVITDNGGLFIRGKINLENKLFRFPETART
jgi:GNAT superfamily N-acetyltransferase